MFIYDKPMWRLTYEMVDGFGLKKGDTFSKRLYGKVNLLVAAVALAVLGLVVFTLFSGSADTVYAAPTSQIAAAVTVTTKLEVNATGLDYPAFTTTLSVEVPSSWTEVQTMIQQPSDELVYRQALDSLLSSLGIHEAVIETFGSDAISEPVSLSIEGDVATLCLTKTQEICGLNTGLCSVGMFEVNLFNDSLYLQAMTSAVPTWTTRVVDIDLEGLDFGFRGEPPNVDDDHGHLTWMFLYGDPSMAVSITVNDPVLRTRLLLGNERLLSANLVTVTTTIGVYGVNTSGTNYPSLESSLMLQVPTDWPGLRTIYEYAPYDSDYAEGLETLLTSIGGLFDSPHIRHNLIYQLQDPPRVTIKDGYATVTFTMTDGIYQLDERSYPIGPLEVQPIESGLFPTSAELLFSVQEAKVPVWTSWVVQISLNDFGVTSVTPLPVAGDGESKMTWIFSGGDSTPRIDIQIEPSPRTSARLILASGVWSYLQRSSWYLAPIVVLLFMLFWALPRLSGGENLLGHIVVGSRRAAILALLLSMSWIFMQVFDHLPEFLNLGFLGLTLWDILPLLLFTLFFLVANKTLGLGSGAGILLAIVASIIIFLPVLWGMIATQFSQSLWQVLQDYHWFHKDLRRWVPMLVVPLWAATYYLFSGTARFVIAFWPGDCLRERTVNQQTRGMKLWFQVSVSALVAVALLQWLGYQHEQLGLWQPIRYLEGELPTGFIQWLPEIAGSLTSYGRNLFALAIDLFPFIGLAGLIGVLFALSGESRSVFFPSSYPWSSRIARLLFAGFVVGSIGWFIGFDFPLAFFVALVVIRYVTRGQWESVEQEMEDLNPDLARGEGSMMKIHQKEFLQRAKALEDLKRKQASLYEKSSKEELSDEAYYEKYKKTLDEQVRLTTGESPTSTQSKKGDKKLQFSLIIWLSKKLEVFFSRETKEESKELGVKVRLPKGISPHQIALALGPKATFWENGVLAAKIGAWIAVIPMGFYIYVLLTESGLRILSSYMGVLSLVRGLLNEVAFWLAAAFVLGILYPYIAGRNGALKGAALSAVYLVSRGANELFKLWIGQEVSSTWTSRVLQLLLFLVAVGVTMDWHTLREKRIYWRHLLDHYQLHDIRTLIGYLSPLAVALFLIGQQLVSGEAQKAVVEIIKSLPQAIPGF
jgi:hypothetical protein